MATDLAEFLGGAIGLSLLFRMPLLAGMAVTAVVTYLILLLDRRGYRPIELVITGLVAVISLSYVAELVLTGPDWMLALGGALHPALADVHAITLAVGIVGATVMPHAIYLHSGLTQSRGTATGQAGRRRLAVFSNVEVVVALGLAGLVNVAMVMMAAAAFHAGHPDVAEIETAYHTLTPLFGGAAAVAFLMALIASGLSSSVVGTMAGQLVMQGFVGWRVPVWLRRLITMVPALVIVGFGADATTALVLSQVVLSLTLPVPLVAMLLLIRRGDVMGSMAVSGVMLWAAYVATAAVVVLNGLLLLSMAGVDLTFLVH